MRNYDKDPIAPRFAKCVTKCYNRRCSKRRKGYNLCPPISTIGGGFLFDFLC